MPYHLLLSAQDVVVTKVHPDEVAVELVELSFKDQACRIWWMLGTCSFSRIAARWGFSPGSVLSLPSGLGPNAQIMSEDLSAMR
jgi:hypothetical protein